MEKMAMWMLMIESKHDFLDLIKVIPISKCDQLMRFAKGHHYGRYNRLFEILEAHLIDCLH